MNEWLRRVMRWFGYELIGAEAQGEDLFVVQFSENRGLSWQVMGDVGNQPRMFWSYYQAEFERDVLAGNARAEGDSTIYRVRRCIIRA